ncbi:MAG TPA: hypothetical protein PKY91_00430 [Rhodocyclaceae bacterium]|nr:hypothetical protein [Rhodocyclaceae bacterium]
METSLGLAHFFVAADGIARLVLGLLLIASLGTWTLIVTKGIQVFRLRRRSEAFLADFWQAPNLEAVAGRLRERGTTDPFSHLVHHGFTAIELQNRGGRRALIDSGSPTNC